MLHSFQCFQQMEQTVVGNDGNRLIRLLGVEVSSYDIGPQAYHLVEMCIRDRCIICVVGDLAWENVGFEAKALDAMRDIPVRMISFAHSGFFLYR